MTCLLLIYISSNNSQMCSMQRARYTLRWSITHNSNYYKSSCLRNSWPHEASGITRVLCACGNHEATIPLDLSPSSCTTSIWHILNFSQLSFTGESRSLPGWPWPCLLMMSIYSLPLFSPLQVYSFQSSHEEPLNSIFVSLNA